MIAIASDKTSISLPEGYIMRPPQPADLSAVVDLLNAGFESLVGAKMYLASVLGSEWEMPGFNLEEDARLVSDEKGAVVGYCDVFDLADPHVRIYLFSQVHPRHTDKGIGSALITWGEQRARQSLPKSPVEAQVMLVANLLSADLKGAQLHQEAGFKLVRFALRMAIELDGGLQQPVLPEGISIRPFVLGQDDEATVRAIRESFADHWGFVARPFEYDLELYRHRWASDEDFDPNLYFLAVDGEEVAGISLCHSQMAEDPEMGWVGTLGVRRPWRRRGLGMALLLHSFHAFKSYGKKRVGLGVDAQSLTGATRLYEKAGMHSLPRWQWSTFEKELRSGIDLSTQTVEF